MSTVFALRLYHDLSDIPNFSHGFVAAKVLLRFSILGRPSRETSGLTEGMTTRIELSGIDGKGGTRVTVESVKVDSDIDFDQIGTVKRSVVWDSVTFDVIYRGADGLGEGFVVQWGRIGAMFNDGFVN